MVIRCLGVVGVVHEGESTSVSKAQRRIIALLTAAGPDGLTSPVFAEELWVANSFPTDWESAVRVAISRLRRAIPTGTIVREDGRYRLNLTTDQVDVWQLLDLARSPEHIAEETAQRLLTGDPYPDLEPSPYLTASSDVVTAARVQLIVRMSLSADATWSTSMLQAALNLVSRFPDREDLVCAVARLHDRLNRRQAARQLLDECARYLGEELGVDPSAELVAFATELHASDSSGEIVRETESATQTVPRVVGIPDLDDPQHAFIDRADLNQEVAESVRQNGSVLTGQAGSGKTAVARSVAARLSAKGHHIAWLSGRRGGSSAYAPVLAIDRTLREALDPLLDDGGDAFTQSRCWSETLDCLERLFPVLPLVLVIDDAHWLDSHTLRLLQFAAAAQQSRNICLLFVGRDDEDGVGWSELVDSLTRSGLSQHHVHDFTESELVFLAGRHHPMSSAKQRADLALQLIEMRAASPAIATELVRQVDSQTLVLRSQIVSDPEAAIWTSRVSERTRDIASVAAVHGLTFRLNQLATLAEVSVEEVIAALDEMLDANLLEAEQRPDEFSFRHILIHQAFESLLARGVRRTLHRRAADIASADIHSRARHLVAATGLAESETIVSALVESAAGHHAQGSYHEAIAAYAAADLQSDCDLDANTLLGYADALDAGGADGWPIRERSFAVAQADEDMDLCVTVAVSAALETEDVMGDARRLPMLEAIDASRLGRDHRLMLDSALARELGLLGHHDRAFEITQSAIDRSENADESFAAWLGAWPSTLSLPVGQWTLLPENRASVVNPELQSRLGQVECLRSLLLGDDEQGRQALAEFRHAPYTATNGLRSWFALLLESMLASCDGELDRADQLANAALELGQLHGITAAFSARAGQLFARYWMSGTHGDLLPLLDMSPPDVGSSWLAEAGHAIAIATVPERIGEAAGLSKAIVDGIVATGTALAPTVAALLASSRSSELVGDLTTELRSILEPFVGTHLIVGTGIASLGPASRALADVAAVEGDGALETQLRQQAIAESDWWKLRAWSVRCRLDLAGLNGNQALVDDARAIAAGSELTQAFFP